jgi:hypothetical protein
MIYAFLGAGGIWSGWVYVPITIDPAAGPPTTTPRYLNVLLDCNSSGTWCDQAGEWIVRNYLLPDFAPFLFVHYPGQTVWYNIGGFTWVNDYSGIHWLRVTLSDAPIASNVPNGWDGRTLGAFVAGETEDWPLTWFYHPPPAPNQGELPPHDDQNPNPPAPIPGCNKTGTIEQVPPPTHVGHSGNFGVRLTNTSPDHPIHIVAGPFPTDENGDPIDIQVTELVSKILQPGESDTSASSWDFDNPGPNQAWCNWDALGDPQGQYVMMVNVGNYLTPTSNQPTGGSFEEYPPVIPSTTNTGLVVLIVALGLVSAFLIVRRLRFAEKS